MTKEDLKKFLKDNNFVEDVIYSLNKKMDVNYSNCYAYHSSYESFDKISFSVGRNRFSNCYMITILLINNNSFNKTTEEIDQTQTEKIFFFGDDFDNNTTEFSKDIINNIKIPTSGVILSIKDFDKVIKFLDVKGIDFDILDKKIKYDIDYLNSLEYSVKRMEEDLIKSKEEIVKITEKIKAEGDFLTKYDNRKKHIRNK